MSSQQIFPAPTLITFFHDVEQNFSGLGFDPAACREVVRRFLEIERKHGIRATYNVVGKIIEDQPDLVQEIIDGGHEIAFHSYFHSGDPLQFSTEIEKCAAVSRGSIRGYRSPMSRWNDQTLSELWKHGFLWNAEADSARSPYYIHQGLIRLPIANDDWPVKTGEMSIDQWTAAFHQLLDQRGSYFGWGSHDCVVSEKPEERLKAWDSLIAGAKERNALAVTFGQAADLFRRASLSHYYTETAKSWNKSTKALYRTMRLTELIRNEASSLQKPVVVDLGSGGGVLSSHLIDIADRIYCVDNAPGMIQDVSKHERIIPQNGDVTASNLDDSCADFIIAARVIEYLYAPELLAREIVRIGKEGATYFVTFPSARPDAPGNSGPDAPDKIRRYFTREEIERWARLVGPGKLSGMQYQRGEPSTSSVARQYRDQEASPPEGVLPQNWIYTGKVQKKNVPVTVAEPLPLNAFTFEVLHARNKPVPVSVKTLGRLFPSPIRKLIKKVLRVP